MTSVQRRALVLVVVLAVLGVVGWWLTSKTLALAEREWCARHSADLASWVVSTALEHDYNDAVKAERGAGRDPSRSDAPAIIEACKGAYAALHETEP
jgi:hypothetical protein